MKLRFFEPKVIEGQKKLVDINNGDFFPFGDEEEIQHTKELLTATYESVEIKDDHHV